MTLDKHFYMNDLDLLAVLLLTLTICDHCFYGICYIVHIVAGETTHVNSAGLHHIDMELPRQHVTLFSCNKNNGAINSLHTL